MSTHASVGPGPASSAPSAASWLALAAQATAPPTTNPTTMPENSHRSAPSLGFSTRESHAASRPRARGAGSQTSVFSGPMANCPRPSSICGKATAHAARHSHARQTNGPALSQRRHPTTMAMPHISRPVSNLEAVWQTIQFRPLTRMSHTGGQNQQISRFIKVSSAAAASNILKAGALFI